MRSAALIMIILGSTLVMMGAHRLIQDGRSLETGHNTMKASSEQKAGDILDKVIQSGAVQPSRPPTSDLSSTPLRTRATSFLTSGISASTHTSTGASQAATDVEGKNKAEHERMTQAARKLARSAGTSVSGAVFDSNTNTSVSPLVLSRGSKHQSTIVPAFGRRDDLGFLLEQEGLKTGAELGVQKGFFARETLSRWSSCTHYLLVDIWAPQPNYDDFANVGHAAQEDNYQHTMQILEPWMDRVQVCRGYTTECVKAVPDGSLDYVYVDARHDYKGVSIDLNEWWPKVKTGGIFAGHDFVDAAYAAAHGQNWSLNYNGTVDAQGRAVKGAVQEFAAKVHRSITLSTDPSWPSWAIRK